MCTKFRYKLFLKEAIQPVTVESELSLSQILHTLNTIFSTNTITRITYAQNSVMQCFLCGSAMPCLFGKAKPWEHLKKLRFQPTEL